MDPYLIERKRTKRELEKTKRERDIEERESVRRNGEGKGREEQTE